MASMLIYLGVVLFIAYWGWGVILYRTIDYVKDVHCPVLLVHSRNDEIVPFEFGLELYEAANEPKEFVEICGSHNDGFLVSGEVYKEAWTKWLTFLAEYESQSGQQAS